MSWHQKIQDLIGNHVSRRLAMRIFWLRVRWFARRGRIESAHTEDAP